jgi:hypothetical protein
VNLQNTLTSAAGASGFIASTFSVAYGFVLNSSQTETMMTWSCKWGDIINGTKLDFQRICTESVGFIPLSCENISAMGRGADKGMI